MGTYTIEYDKSKCIGAANCVAIAPETWEMGKDGIAIAKLTRFEDKDLAKNVDAAVGCPTHAIVIRDEKGNQLV
jgi:ferredoxin